MELESVRSLKQELLARGLTRRTVTREILSPHAAAVASALPATPPPPSIALGVTGKPGEFRLAVRVQQVTPGIQANLDEIQARANGEVALRITGRVVKQQLIQRVRPLQAGFSVGHFRITAGTLGGFVFGDNSADPLILSNNHVLANENQAQAGDAILQPGPFDHGQAADEVATLSDFVQLALPPDRNRVDVAVALVEQGIGTDPTDLQGLGPFAGLRDTPLETDEVVFKVGRTTGLTRGKVTAIEIDDLTIRYDIGDLTFDDQIEIAPADPGQPFSQGGDSGSLIVDADRRAVALLFAGNDVDVTYANPIAVALAALNVHF